ncbi:ABC1 kinase family protein [Amycolatopsis speibonae]|uniref:ABC1 kinase family protein n=1 Tax=Amycolatopsis speibonae TaxID=1450224 RepID=A0ABV7NS27_9PSEU
MQSSRLRIAARLAEILAVAAWHLARALPVVLFARVVSGPAAARRGLWRCVVGAIQDLGPAFVKFGQIAGTRVDLLPPEALCEFRVLHDAVRPPSKRAARGMLQSRQGIRVIDPVPLGSGSIACVHRGELEDGTPVALKVKRPGIDRRMWLDLRLIRVLARVSARLPSVRGMPMADLVDYVTEAIAGQLDFAREAENIHELRAHLAGLPEVRVPEVHRERSSEDCLVLEYLPGLDARTPDSLPPETRAELGAAVLAAAHRMMFVAGFVHCDLHPGNVYLTTGRVVILDAGYCVRLPDRVRDLIGEFFARLAAGEGRRCGEIILESAAGCLTDVDEKGFVESVAESVGRRAGPGNTFDMAAFGEEIFGLQRQFGLYATADFVFPLMALLVLAGTVRGFTGDVDFQSVGLRRGSP